MSEADHWKECPVCGKPHCVGDLKAYVFQRTIKTPKKENITLWFCGWNCLVKWEKDTEGRKKAIAKREKYVKTGEEKCSDCRYCIKGRYGFVDCTLRSGATNPEKDACKRFKPKYDYQESVCED